jgi:hypothetical protein
MNAPTPGAVFRWSGLSEKDGVIKCRVAGSGTGAVSLFLERTYVHSAFDMGYMMIPPSPSTRQSINLIRHIMALHPELDFATAQRIERRTRQLATPGDVHDPYKLVRLLEAVGEEVCLGSSQLLIQVCSSFNVPGPIWACALAMLQTFILDMMVTSSGDRCAGDIAYIKSLQAHSNSCVDPKCTVQHCGLSKCLREPCSPVQERVPVVSSSKVDSADSEA